MFSASRFLIIVLLLASTITLQSQCPSSDSFYRRIYQMVNAPLLSEKERLAQLLDYNKQLSNCSIKNDSTVSYLLRRIGVCYNKMGDYTHAIEYTKKAIDVIRANINRPAISVNQLPVCYYNLQMFYDSINENSLQREATDSCIAVDLRLAGNYYYASQLFTYKIVDLFNRGEYILCLKWSELSEKILIKNYPDSRTDIWYAIIYQVNALNFLKQHDQAEKLLSARINSPQYNLNPDSLGSIYMSLGVTNNYKKSYHTAINYFQKAAEKNKKIHYKIGYAQALHWTGFIYADKLGDFKTGMSFFKKALSLADDIDAISILDDMAKACVKNNLFDSAFYFFQMAFNRIKPGVTEKELVELAAKEVIEGKTIEYLARLVIDKGDALLKQYKTTKDVSLLNKAVDVYKLADQLLTRVKSMQLEPETKLFWRANTKSLYENAIEASYLLSNVEAGFYFFEKSRAVLLNDQLNEQRWISEKDIVKRSKLENEIAEHEKQLALLDKSSTRYNDLQNQLIQKRQELEQLQEIIKTNNPLYYQNYLDRNFITLKNVDELLLNDHQGLVELFSGDSAVYVLLITSKQSLLRKIDKNLFDSLSKTFTSYISSSQLLNKNFSGFSVISHQLYLLIFGNFEIPKGRVIISPDGQYFPFEALIKDPQKVNYFLNDFAVSYTYSARWLLNDFGINSTSSTKSFLGVAPVRFAEKLPALNGSDESLKRIQYYFDHATLLNSTNASKRNFVNQYADYKIIQLYTHGTVAGSTGEPMIYFSDSALSISELIYGRRPSTNLVVLAACETGLGDLHPGEGVFSFNRAFAALGIPSAVSNLWQVDSRACYRITELFYKNVADGAPLDLAMQKAKIEYLSKEGWENKLPYFWAAPVLVGQTNKISVERSSWIWLGVMGLFLVIAIWLEMRTTEKNQKLTS